MSAFDDARKVEEEGRKVLIPFLRQLSCNGQFVLTDKGRLSFVLQKKVGDALGNLNDGAIYGYEFKIEAEDRHGNFFLETWSNLSRYTLGWMYLLQTDFLWYYFVATYELYAINFHRLRQWAFREPSRRNGYHGRLYDWPEKEQKLRDQKNDTWGRCVPIRAIEKEVGFTKHDLNQYDPCEGSQLKIPF